MAETENFFLKAVAQTDSGMLHRVIGNSFIIEYGIVKAVPADGIVTVEMSVAQKNTDVVITDCVLASLASSSLSLNVKPNIDDKVLVLFPRKYHGDMFQVSNNEPIIYEQGTGYDILSGIAILLNQFQADHRNYIDVADGEVTAKLAYSEDDDKNLVEFTSDKEGNIELKNDKMNLKISSEGELTVNNEKSTFTSDDEGNIEIKNDKANVKISSEGEVTVDNEKATVTIDSDGNVKVDAQGGKISLKNNSASLFDILDGMLKILNSSLATAGSPASHTVVPQQFSQQSTQLSQLME